MKPQEAPAVVNPRYSLEDNLRSERFMREVAALKSKHITPERMVRIALNAINRQPELRECTQPSFFSALMRLSEVGLEPDDYHAHIIPFNNKIKNSSPPKYRKEAQLIIDYKGLVTVIRRNPAIAVVKGAVVYEHDKFTYREGSDRYFEHEPAWDEEDHKAGVSAIKGAYCFIKFANINDWEVDFLPRWKIEKARASSRSGQGDRSPWVTNYDEMCIKTALRHHSKTLPLTSEERQAMLIDDDTIDLDDNRGRLPQRVAEFRNSKKVDIQDEASPVSDEPLPEDREEPDARTAQAEVTKEDPKEENAEFDRAISKLSDLMKKDHVTDAEMIFVLVEHSVDTGEAERTGSIADLPLDTLKLASGKQWATFFFSINAKRKLASAEIQK